MFEEAGFDLEELDFATMAALDTPGLEAYALALDAWATANCP